MSGQDHNHARLDRWVVDSFLARVTRHGVRGPSTRADVRRTVVDVVLVAAAVAGAVVLMMYVDRAEGGAATPLVLLMAVVAASAGSAAALMAAFTARLTGDPRVTWIGLALGWYSLLAIPTSTIRALGAAREPVLGAANVLVHGSLVSLLLVVLFAPPPPSIAGAGRAALAAGVILVSGTAVWGTAFPASAEGAASSGPLWLVFSLVWTGTALAVVVVGTRRRERGLWTVGVGLAVLGAAHTWRVLTPSWAAGDAGAAFAALRLAAVLVVLWGTLRLAQRTLVRLDAEQVAHEEELERVEIRLARRVERDHELRNGLAGLAGATRLLGVDRPESALLGRVVASELDRLDDLLQITGGQGRRSSSRSFAVEPVLDGLVALRRSCGTDVRVDADPGLRAVGSPHTFAQVITNLVGNAERHAPGSPVRITAVRHGGRVVVRVRDFGPGVGPGREEVVFERGTRDPAGGGLGLGLPLCRRLLAFEDGAISIRPADPRAPGCVVVVELPEPSTAAQASRVVPAQRGTKRYVQRAAS